ncbi:MAG: acyl-CoA reductase [Rikenellaceae bacterium]
MKKFIDIANDLRLRLAEFGDSAESKALIESAVATNQWFTPREVGRSVEAICTQMLDTGKLSEWLAHYPTLPAQKARRVAIIMAGNIPLVGFFDLLCALAAGHQAWIKPSSKDRVLMDYICQTLRQIEPGIPIYIYDEQLSYDAIIATGGEAANKYFEHKFANTRRICRGNRHSIAVLAGDENLDDMQLLAKDIYSYSGLGCRNVAMIFAPKGYKVQLPQKNVGEKYYNNYLQNKALHTMHGGDFIDTGSSILLRSQHLPTSLSTISVWEYDSLEQVERWINEHDNELQCVVSHSIDHPRRVEFGAAQQPTLWDYADGVDTMHFLEFKS